MNEAARPESVTPYSEVNEVIAGVVAGIHNVLGPTLLGVYLYGSAVTGDFDPALSDIDLLAVLARDVDDEEFDGLYANHNAVARAFPAWEGRIETHYISLPALQTFRTHQQRMLVISPGEPFHRLDVQYYYLANWYIAQEHGIAVFGPSPRTLIPLITKQEFLKVVREHLRLWKESVQTNDKRLPALAYAVLTLCRAFYTLTLGEQTSKRRAALWTRRQLPEWAPLIDDALLWREQWRDLNDMEDEEAFQATVRFVNTIIEMFDERKAN